jgi:dTDP-L-rhamnose 4-epimerase
MPVHDERGRANGTNGNGSSNGNGQHGRGRVLITGGAGFVGSHLADELLRSGYQVRALDVLSEQVHGPDCTRPAYLDPEVELIRGDVRDPQAVRGALEGVDAVFHFAAAVGVGQSMYEIRRYTDVNNVGTAVLLEALAANPVGKLVVASSMSVYGEGLYANALGQVVECEERTPEQLARGEWELMRDGAPLEPLPTPESKTSCPSSVYALSKYDQEKLCLVVGRSYGIPTAAMRFFNIYGTRQALSNPYTGVLAIFASRYLNCRPPLVYEDGRQRRDFVHVHDVARACRMALESPAADGGVFNVGSGRSRTVLEIASAMADALGIDDLPPQITGKYRAGDIRHCFADTSLAERVLGFRAEVELEQGLTELVEWMLGQQAFDRVDDARAELARRGLQR